METYQADDMPQHRSQGLQYKGSLRAKNILTFFIIFFVVHYLVALLLLLFSHSVVSDSATPWTAAHAGKLPCPSPSPRACSNSGPLSRWCHPTISSTVVSFSSHLQSFPASGSFLMSQLFAWGSQRIGVSASASVIPMNTQDWSPLGLTGLISLQSKRTKTTTIL